MALSRVERESKEVSGTVSCGEGARSVCLHRKEQRTVREDERDISLK